MELTRERKQEIQEIVDKIYDKSCNGYSFDDFAIENRIERIREYDFGSDGAQVALTFRFNDGYAIVISKETPLEERTELYGHEFGHVCLGHVEPMDFKVDNAIEIGEIKGDSPEERAEADYFKEQFCKRFSHNGWLDLEKLKDFRMEFD